jgi:hypothetical protein
MNGSFVFYILIPIALILAIPFCVRIVNGPAFQQKADEVVVREPGKHLFGKPKPVITEAVKDFEFALLSQVVYQHKPDAKQMKADECVDADAMLASAGWLQWKNFSDAKSEELFEKYHLRVEVWSKVSTGCVAVAFAGTEVTNLQDWKANLRWFIPHHVDEYTVVVTNFGADFVDEWLKRKKEPEWQFLNHAHLFSTGHSLGGGLCQEFAYSLPLSSEVPRVEHVYAFDPSPVTGFYSVERRLRDHDREGLAIDRIYERGKILAILRSVVYVFKPPSVRNPAIRQVRYNLFSAWTAVAKHSIGRLACGLYDVVKNQTGDPTVAGCSREPAKTSV